LEADLPELAPDLFPSDARLFQSAAILGGLEPEPGGLKLDLVGQEPERLRVGAIRGGLESCRGG
jgi:hypothetical protein